MIEAGVKMRSEFFLLKRGKNARHTVTTLFSIASVEFFSIRDNFKVEIYRVSFYKLLHFFFCSRIQIFTHFIRITFFFTFLAT
jgi:dolichol kinase